MSLCEKGESKVPENREIVFGQLELDVNADYKILNLILSMDTGQATIQLQNKSMKPGLSAKLAPKAVVLSEELTPKIKDEVIAEVYKQFEAKQVKSSVIKKMAEEIQSLDLSEQIAEIEAQHEEKILDVRVKTREEKQKLASEKDARKALQAEAGLDKAEAEAIDKIQQDKEKAIADMKEAEEQKIKNKYQLKLDQIMRDYQ